MFKTDMMEQERLWFDKLHNNQQEDWKTFSKKRYKGFFDSLIYKYNDNAHFLYELLQNADDAGATDIEITLERNRIIFSHNGSERFSVSNLDTEEYDRAKGRLGHINAITAINFSSKVQLEEELERNKIGKFGIGFKAIFQYTATPYIYDDGICFKIENFIVPTLLDDTTFRQRGKTVFVLPFDQETTKDMAYTEIEQKLQTLEHPQLYLNHIKNIHWKTETVEGSFSQEITKEYNNEKLNIHAERLAIRDAGEEETDVIKLSRVVSVADCGKFPIAITYYLKDAQTIDWAKKRKLHCFFPTNESIGTCYAVNAPFSLTDSRQSLRGGEPVNRILFEEIAKLAADSLLVLRDISTKEGNHLLGDDIKKLIEVKTELLSNWQTLIKSNLFRDVYDNVLKWQAVFLSSHGEYLLADDVCWSDKDTRDLLSTEQLQALTGKKDFALCSCSNYLSDVKGLGVSELSTKELGSRLNSEFLLAQDDEWLDKLYRFVEKNGAKYDDKIGDFRYSPIFKTDAGTFVAAFSHGNEQPTLYLYTEGITKSENCINQKLCSKSESFRSLIKLLDIKEASRLDYIKIRLTDKEQLSWSRKEANDFWKILVDYWNDCNDEKKKEFHCILSKGLLLKCNVIASDDKNLFAKLSSLYQASEDIESYFRRAANAYWWHLKSKTYSDAEVKRKQADVCRQYLFDENHYTIAKESVGEEKFCSFIDWLHIERYPKNNLFRVVIFLSQVKIDTDELKDEVRKLSHYVWEMLSHRDITHHTLGKEKNYPDLKHWGYSKDTSLVDFLRQEKWLVVDGERVCTQDISQEDLFRNGYEKRDLMELLGIKQQEVATYSYFKNVLSQKMGGNFDDKTLEAIIETLPKLLDLQHRDDDQIVDGNSSRTLDCISKEELLKGIPRYTYKWFKLLIDLEAEASGTVDEDKKRRALKVRFASVVFPPERDIIRLECASCYVPVSIEEVDGLEVTFYGHDGNQKKLSFDAVSVKDSILTLKVKQSNVSVIEDMRHSGWRVSHAEINVEQPIELLQSWRRLIHSLNFHDTYSLKANIRRDVKFIFGPPGTGKTHQLATRIINLMNERQTKRILVLTPTNKACDVLTEKIMDLAPLGCSWLFRFAKTMSERIENEGVLLYHDTPIAECACLITTIARYAYDNCSEGALRELGWDYVIIDEASMIPLYQIIAPLYNKGLHNILIAGDPFQIQPIVQKEQWKGENIYTMLELQDFATPTTNPAGLKVETLTKQWRSVPEIGNLYSQYSYNGLLTHNRRSTDLLKIDIGIDAMPLNIVTFPVNKESKFAPHRLKGSNIHPYSVIFVCEFLKHITRHIAQGNASQEVSIGVVGPYVAEIQSISKMYEQLGEHYANIKMVFGSAHGFQGDECNIVIAVMNPPASGLIKSAQRTLINNRNILNVSVSRASDYLFVVVPNEEYELSDKLVEVNSLKNIMRQLHCKEYTHEDIETLIYGHKGEIEGNMFVTSHQMTNVYSDFSKKYEIRLDETSMDIQVNDTKTIQQ